MALEETGGDCLGLSHFGGAVHDSCFVFTKSQEEDLAAFKNCADTHGDGAMWNIMLAKKSAGRVATSNRIEGYHPGSALLGGTGFIEANVARPTNSQNQ